MLVAPAIVILRRMEDGRGARHGVLTCDQTTEILKVNRWTAIATGIQGFLRLENTTMTLPSPTFLGTWLRIVGGIETWTRTQRTRGSTNPLESGKGSAIRKDTGQAGLTAETTTVVLGSCWLVDSLPAIMMFFDELCAVRGVSVLDTV